ncbi:arginine--tRNA ligase [Frigoribacterium faeni]|uniref:Arginine--tRNA ligase n=1 Tax=Frigoribacterium faeni TaxID=145483 RepID=A0A7W3JGU4_9MICO|nr:arginine--tRNA ligase [Frigoribacterium faeni]MBA8812543.1 arginyl-tRNA synthetase [Frigoribacterium faeni]BFF13637.1 arginine--tRNA ligase [Microbacterium flavescens]GEK81739.1 arginine--tRNA ligase [Frigoribacterium faeni]
MTPAELSTSLLAVVSGVLERRGLADEVAVTPADVVLERPRNLDHGDWTTNVAMKFAKRVGSSPRELATEIAGELAEVDGVADVDVAGPGFINIRLDAAAAGLLAQSIVEQGDAYGRGDYYEGVTIDLEFVSANPTGPIHLGGVRWAAVGDSLARVFQAQGALVTREYYFNDHGGQIDRFSRSLLARALGEPTPEDGYGGQYISDIADRVMAAVDGDVRALPRDEAQETFRSVGVDFMFDDIKASLHDFGVDFDVYFHENALHESKAVDRAVARLRELGHVYEAEGATWLRTTEFGDDRDRVIIKTDGEAAYIAGDLAYYLDKRERGFERNLIMLGADHHGYVGRMMAMCAAFGDEPGVNLEILIGQMVNLLRDGEPLRMSKRNGTVVTMEDLVDAVGVDAGRYSLVRSPVNSSIDIDLDLLTRRSNDNPVFYVQYAHARTRAVARNAEAAGVTREAFDAALLSHPTEAALLGALAELPRVVRQAAELREPHRVARYVEELAGTYHRWYDSCRVTPLGDEAVTDLHRTRLWLNDAAGQVIRNGLGLLGVSAPDRM